MAGATPSARPAGGLPRVLVTALVLGVAAGVLTLAGQGVLPAAANRLANSGAVWLVLAFTAGALAAPGASRGALAGLVAVLAALGGYEVAARVAATGISTGALMVWLGAALAGGPVFGAAGSWWRTGAVPRPAIAAALLGAVFVAEGLWTVARIPDLALTGWVEVAVGVIVATVGARPRERRQVATSLALLVPWTMAGLVAYAGIERALGA